MPKIKMRRWDYKSKRIAAFDEYHYKTINSLTLNADKEHFLTSDEQEICLWNIN